MKREEFTEIAKQVFKGASGEQLEGLWSTCEKHQITTSRRVAHFFAQVMHESANLKYCKEIASEAAYEGQADLGNTEKGDGQKFKGAGYLQVTGRANYQKFSDYIGDDPVIMEKGCEYVAEKYPFAIAGFWWESNSMNEKCDSGLSVKEITRKVNGGYNGLEQREKYFDECIGFINAREKPETPSALGAFGASMTETRHHTVSEFASHAMPDTHQPPKKKNEVKVQSVADQPSIGVGYTRNHSNGGSTNAAVLVVHSLA